MRIQLHLFLKTFPYYNRLPKEALSDFCSGLIEYETPKVVTVHNPTIGLLRRSLQLGVVLYVGLYQLWYAQGYQEFAGMESSVTTKVLPSLAPAGIIGS